jgi:hypothetical protein
MTFEEHIRVLNDLLRTEHEQWIAEVQRWADDAGAAGDLGRQRRHLAHVERLKAIPYPWEVRKAGCGSPVCGADERKW